MKIDRLLAILTILLQKEQITAPELARRMEVSRRTIGRDIDDLCMAGFPIITRQGTGGGISISDAYKLDKSVLTKDELQSILIGLKGLESVDGTSGIEKLLQKLAPVQDAAMPVKDSVVIDLSSHYKDSLSEKMKQLKTAVAECRRVSFDYYSDKGIAHRIIEPYFTVYKWSAWYVFGYCSERSDFRLFKLNRLWKLEITDEVFQKRPVHDDKLNLGGHLTDHENMVLIFDKSVEYLLVEEYGPDCYVETADGKLRFERGYTNRDYTIRWIMGFGDKAEVFFPSDLRDEVKELARKTFEKYK